MNGNKPTTSDGKSEGDSSEKSSVMHINVAPPPGIRRTIAEPMKCSFPTPIRPTFAPPRPVMAAVQPNTIPVSGSASACMPGPSTVANAQPVITKAGIVQAGSTLTVCAPMASIIRGPVGPHPQPSFTSHATHPAMQTTYSSHLPRGAAAVACITTLKSNVACPITRSHILASNVVTASPSHLMQPRMPGINAIRGPLPSVSKTTLSSLASDISHISTSTTSNMTPTQIVLASSRANDATLRPAVVHGAAVISKPHSFVQQIPSLEKGFYKPNVSPATILPVQATTTSVTLATSHAAPHMAVAQQNSPLQSLSVTLPSSIALPSSTIQIHLPIHQQLVSHSISITGAQVGNITPSIVSSSITHSHANLPKVITHTVSPVPHIQASNLAVSNRAGKTAPISTSVVSQSGSKPMISPGSSLSASQPVAKVNPQPPLAVVTRPASEGALHGEPIRNPGQTALFVSPTHRAAVTHLSVNTNPSSSTPGIVVSGSNTTTGSSNVILAEGRQERSVVANSTYNFPTGPTNFYEPLSGIPNTLTMHTLPGSSSSSHAFTAVPANIRTGFMTPHPSSTLSVHQPVVRTTSVSVNSVMMTSTRPPQIMSSLADTTTSLTTEPGSTIVPSANSTVTYSSSGSTASSPVASASSSPRPSILRKRAIDGSQVSNAAKRNLLACLSPSKIPSPQPEVSAVQITNSSHPSKQLSDREAARENGQISESVTSTSNSTSAINVTIKQEQMESSESLATSAAVAGLLQFGPPPEASPRKKPRKQQLTGNELVETHSTEGEEEFEKDTKDSIKKEIIQEDTSRGNWISRKNRSPVTLLNSYHHTWKSRHNHFLRYTDVKPREERRPTVFELANQKWVTQKVNGWKVYHLCAQMEDVVDLEGSVHSRLMALLDEMEKKDKAKDDDDIDLDRTIELMRGNIQRCKLIRDQMKDARHQILKVLDHKTRVSEIVSKYVPKQSSRRREKMLLY